MKAIVASRDPRVIQRVTAVIGGLPLSYRIVQPRRAELPDEPGTVYFLDAAVASELAAAPRQAVIIAPDTRSADELSRTLRAHQTRVLQLAHLTRQTFLQAMVLATARADVDELVRCLRHVRRFSHIDADVVVAFLEHPAGMVRLTDLRRALAPLSRQAAQRLVRVCGFTRAEHLFTALRSAAWALLMDRGVPHGVAEGYLGITDRTSFRRACRRAAVPTLGRGLRLEMFEDGVEHLWHVMPDVALSLSGRGAGPGRRTAAREWTNPDLPIREDVVGGTADDLLVACVSLQPRDAALHRLAELSEAEWEEILRRAHRHDLIPLLRHQLNSAAAAAVVPRRVARTLDVVYDDMVRTSARRHDALSTLLGRLSAQSIPVIVLKGAYLAEAVYGDPALRPMEDVDLLVPGSEVERARHTLIALGYRCEDTSRPTSHDVLDCHLPTFSKDDLSVELHWSIEGRAAPDGGARIHRPHPVDIDGVWSRAEEVRIAGEVAYALAPHDCVLHLALHAAFHHAFNVSLQKVCDVAWVARHFQATIDWTRIIEAAAAIRAERFARVFFRLVHEAHGSVVPRHAATPANWTDEDERVFEAIRALVLRSPRGGTREWLARRTVIDPWWHDVSGIRARSPGRSPV